MGEVSMSDLPRPPQVRLADDEDTKFAERSPLKGHAPRPVGRIRRTEAQDERAPEAEPGPSHRERYHRPIFCILASTAASITLLFEFRANNWVVLPLSCPSYGPTGMPAFEDGSPCESNLMLGVSMHTLTRMGAKHDVLIFEEGEWWRLITAGWLHTGIFHLLINLLGLLGLGIGVERVFGWRRTVAIYIASGLVGTIGSAALLPGVISVGASASVCGLVGSYWADLFMNYLARGTLKGAGIAGLLVGTVPTLLAGLMPWVDNFMHLGGLLTGASITCLLLPQLDATVPSPSGPVSPLVLASPMRRRGGPARNSRVYLPGGAAAVVPRCQSRQDATLHATLPPSHALSCTRVNDKEFTLHDSAEPPASTWFTPCHSLWRRLCALAVRRSARLGYNRLSRGQCVVLCAGALLLIALTILAALVVTHSHTQQLLRSCRWCSLINCVEVAGWWSCCLASMPGRCTLSFVDVVSGDANGSSVRLHAACNVTGLPPFDATCNPRLDEACARWDPQAPATTSALCQRLCLDC
jgi:membrane associated rhomboid family serine protease